MKRLTAAEVENRFDELLDSNELETVIIEQDGNDIAVLLSKFEYDKMVAQSSGDDLAK